jgi:hypothetical protein
VKIGAGGGANVALLAPPGWFPASCWGGSPYFMGPMGAVAGSAPCRTAVCSTHSVMPNIQQAATSIVCVFWSDCAHFQQELLIVAGTHHCL